MDNLASQLSQEFRALHDARPGAVDALKGLLAVLVTACESLDQDGARAPARR